MATTYAQVNHENLRWARQRAQLSVDALAKKLNVTTQKLTAWENGGQQPTFNQAKSLAAKTYTPFGYLFLHKTPKDNLPIPDLRTVGSEPIKQPSAELLKIIQIVIARQQWYQEYIAEQGVTSNPYIGKFTINNSVDEIVSDMRIALGVEATPSCGDWQTYQKYLVEQIEKIGILVMRHGDLGHHTKQLSVAEFRGFAIYHDTSPVIFVNQADVPNARLFTLIHELAHLWIGQSGVSDASTTTHRTEEALCNAVAAELLVPKTEFLTLWQGGEDWQQTVSQLAAHFRVSKWVLARRALTLHCISQAEHDGYILDLKQQYEKEKSERKQTGGPNYYRIKNNQISKTFSRALVAETLSGNVLLRDAGDLLGIKPYGISKLSKELGI